MIRRPPRSSRTDTLFPYTTLFRSTFCFTDLNLVCTGGGKLVFEKRCGAPNILFVSAVCTYGRNSQPLKELFEKPILMGRDVFFRSEEHTSELQSLMRISYAVYCLYKTISNLCNT